MASYTASVSNFSLTSSWTVSYNGSYYSIAVAPNTDSADKTFDFTGIPAGSVINSATLTATMNSPATGAALRTVDGGSFSGSKGVSIAAGGYSTFRFRFKANGSAGAPTGAKSSTLSFSGVTITVDYTPPGESGSGGNPTPPATPANIGTLSAYPTTLTAGQTLYVDIGPSDSDLTRYVRLYRTDTGEHLFTMLAGHGNTAASPNFGIPLAWCGLAPNDTQFQITVQLYAEKPGPSWGGVAYQTINVLVPDSAKPTIGTFSATRVANGVNVAITKYVQNYSKVSLTMGDVAGELGSSIVSYEITGGGFSAMSSSATLGPLSQSGNITFTAKAVDSRGRVGLKTVEISVEPYSAVSANNLQAYRSDASKNPADEGAFATLIGKLIFSPIDGQNVATIKGRVYEKGTAAPGWTTMADNTLVLFGGSLSVEKAYTAEISIDDLIASYLYSVDIPTGTVIMGIAPDGDGVSFGTYPEAGKVKSVWPISAPNVTQQNVFHNWDFRAPINQRGVSGAISTGTYFYDRWMRNSGTVTTNADYLAIGASAVIEQRIEGNLLAGKTVTVSVQAGGTVYSGTGTMPASEGTVSVTLTGWGTAVLGYATGYMYVRLSPTAASDVQAVKLEMGTVSTLYIDPPMDRVVELLKCQRFLYVIGGNSYSRVGIAPVIYSTTVVGTVLPIPTPMRVSPTSSFIGNWGIYNFTTDALVSNVTSVSTTSSQMSSNLISIEFLGSGLTNGAWYAIHARNDANAKILLSAEL